MIEKTLIDQATLIKQIREFFWKKDFVDLLSPPMVENPGMETHIHSMKVIGAKDQQLKGYLHTSPEFFLKKVLSFKNKNLEKIFSINYCYRDEPNSFHHRNQFIMLEWYRTHEDYFQIMQDAQDLILDCSKKFPQKFSNKDVTKKTVQELFQEMLDIDILNYLDTEKLCDLIKTKFPQVPLPAQKLSWDDYYFLLFLNEIEPKLEKYPILFLYNFPAPLSALSEIDKNDPRVCKRFEIYCFGLELANCYQELTNLDEQKKRFQNQAKEKKSLYGYELPNPSEFYESMQRGLPESSGIALGVDRLLMILNRENNKFSNPFLT